MHEGFGREPLRPVSSGDDENVGFARDRVRQGLAHRLDGPGHRNTEFRSGDAFAQEARQLVDRGRALLETGGRICEQVDRLGGQGLQNAFE